MTRTTLSSFQPRQSNHGHKRKGKPVEAWMLELEKAQDEENGSHNLDLSAIEKIADGVEQMVFSWGLHKQERGQEYAKLSKSLSKGNNSHVLLPWSLNNKREDGQLDSASENVLMVKNKTMEMETQPLASVGTKRASPKRATQRGSRGFDTGRDFSLETASENPQSLKSGKPLHPCHGVLTSSNRMQDCVIGEILHKCETRARDDSACFAMAPEQESICESIELEIGKDNCMSDNMCISGSSRFIDTSKNGHNAKEDELQCNRSLVWTPEATILKRNQQSMLKNEYPPFVQLTNDSPPLFSQSPLCAESLSQSPRPETTQSSEVISTKKCGFFTSLTDLPLCSPISENEQEGAAPILPILDASPCCGEDTESVEVGGHTIKVTALRGSNNVLEDKFQALVNINACALGIQEEHQFKPSPTSDVEDLQIALLECAMEYEIKTIEAKMKMQELKLKGQQCNVTISRSEQTCLSQRAIEPVVAACEKTMDNQRLQQLKKQMTKLQHEKDNLNNELHAFREKERQFERQKRSLEDALLRVNRLQREVGKKEQEVVEWQLKEKETKAQLQEVGEKLRRERHAQELLPLEPKKLLTLLPALREWLRSLKKVGLAKATERRQFQEREQGDTVYPHMTDGYNHVQSAALHSRDNGIVPVVPAHLSLLGQLSEELANQSNPALNVHQVDMVICCLTKEIHALQKELSKLAKN